jgi:hypothetical protein
METTKQIIARLERANARLRGVPISQRQREELETMRAEELNGFMQKVQKTLPADVLPRAKELYQTAQRGRVTTQMIEDLFEAMPESGAHAKLRFNRDPRQAIFQQVQRESQQAQGQQYGQDYVAQHYPTDQNTE